MDTLSRYKIQLTDLPDDGATFDWHLDDTFFSALDEQDITHGSLDATLRVNRKSGAYQLYLRVKGEVSIPCDRCLEAMTQPIDAEDTINVRLGDSYDDDGETITVAEAEAEVNVAWNIYETIALAIPIYHVHPDGQCPEEINSFFAEDNTESPKPTDERWEALRSLLSKPN